LLLTGFLAAKADWVFLVEAKVEVLKVEESPQTINNTFLTFEVALLPFASLSTLPHY